LEDLYQDYKDEGLMIITLITENYDGEAPDMEELNEWADEYDETFPVLSDADYEVTLRYATRDQVSLPQTSLLAPGSVILVADGNLTEEDVIESLGSE